MTSGTPRTGRGAHPIDEAALRRTRPKRSQLTARSRLIRSAGLALLGLAAAACSADDSGPDTSSARDAMESVDADAGGVDDAADGEQPVEGVAGASEPVPPGGLDLRGRYVVRTAHIQLEVEDSSAAAEEVTRIAEDVGGYVATADLQRDSDGVVSGRISLRVPSDSVDDVVDELDQLAESVPERRIDEEDVTGELTDLDAEVTNLTAYEAELRELLTEVRSAAGSEAGAVEGLMTVFERLNEVRARIDRISARREVLADRVEYATVHVTLTPTVSATPVGAVAWDPGDTLHSAFASTTRALATIADAMIRFVVTVLPVAVVVTAPIAAVLWTARRLMRRRAAR